MTSSWRALPLIELAGIGWICVADAHWSVGVSVPLTFTSLRQKGPTVGTERRTQAPPWNCEGPRRRLRPVDGLEHGWPGGVGVVGAERHLPAGLVLGALHVELHADPTVGVTPKNQPVTGLV